MERAEPKAERVVSTKRAGGCFFWVGGEGAPGWVGGPPNRGRPTGAAQQQQQGLGGWEQQQPDDDDDDDITTTTIFQLGG